MADAQTYSLKLYDTEIAQFRFVKTMAGFRAQDLAVNGESMHLLPLNIMQARNDVELNRFLLSRRIPKGRIFLEEVLRPYGLSPSDTKGIIDLSRGASVNDAYSIVPAGDDIPYRDYNLFENDFDEVLQVIAYTGVVPAGILGGGRPSDLTPSGTFPKTWRKRDGQLVLYKAGSAVAAPNYGREPWSETLAWQVARCMGVNAVEYRLAYWQGKACSTCTLFNTPDVAFVPFELCLPAELARLCDFELVHAYYSDLGDDALEAFKSMAVFDSIIVNTDRHMGNFGVLRDNRTGSILGAAPVFDNNVSLFTRDLDEWLSTRNMFSRFERDPGILDAMLRWQGKAMLGAVQHKQVKRLLDFSFENPDIAYEDEGASPNPAKQFSQNRLESLSSFIRQRAVQLVGE